MDETQAITANWMVVYKLTQSSSDPCCVLYMLESIVHRLKFIVEDDGGLHELTWVFDAIAHDCPGFSNAGAFNANMHDLCWGSSAILHDVFARYLILLSFRCKRIMLSTSARVDPIVDPSRMTTLKRCNKGIIGDGK